MPTCCFWKIDNRVQPLFYRTILDLQPLIFLQKMVLNRFPNDFAKRLAIKTRCVGATLLVHLRLTQSWIAAKPGYMHSIWDAAGKGNCKPVETSGARPVLTSPGAEDALNATEPVLHRRCCGQTQNAVTRRPDLMYPLKELGRRFSILRVADMKSLKFLLTYISGAMDMAMVH